MDQTPFTNTTPALTGGSLVGVSISGSSFQNGTISGSTIASPVISGGTAVGITLSGVAIVGATSTFSGSTITSTGVISTTSSAIIGATALTASERFKAKGGTYALGSPLVDEMMFAAGIVQAGYGFEAVSSNTNGVVNAFLIRNTNAGSSAATQMSIQNDNGSSTGNGYFFLNSSTNATFAGANSMNFGSKTAVGILSGDNLRITIATGGPVSFGTASPLTLNSVTASTSPTTGALIVGGGGGFAGGLRCGSGVTAVGGALSGITLNAPVGSGGTWVAGTFSGTTLNNPILTNPVISGSLTLGNARVDGVLVCSGYLTIVSSTGGTFKIPVSV